VLGEDLGSPDLSTSKFVQHEYPSLASLFEIILKEWQGANLDNPQFCKPPIPSSRHGRGENPLTLSIAELSNTGFSHGFLLEGGSFL